jgi:hypothetical protein
VISDSQYDALLASLYSSAIDPARMSDFIRELGQYTGSHIGTFLRQDFADPGASALLTEGVEPEEVLRYSEFGGENIWMQRSLSSIHTGAVLNGDEYVGTRELVASRYYNDFLRHMDVQHSVGVCLSYQRQRAVFLTVGRSASMGGFDDDSLQLFKRIAPHLVNAFSIQMQFEHLHAHASQVTRQQRGMFLFDAQWRWVGGNPVAEQMVATGWWRGRLMSRLEPAHPQTRTAWQSMQRMLQAGITHHVMAVHDKQGALAAFASVHVHSSAAVGEHAPRHVMFVRPLHSPDTGAVNAQLMQIFGLTAAEATLALALRKHGDTVHAAAAIGIAEATARTRLQVVFEKTATRRQADLMLLVDALAETVA